MKATVTDVSKRIDVKANKQEGFIKYDIDNLYPQRVVDIINASGTGTLCTSIFAKFIYGGGFKNEELARTVVNSKKKLTANKLLYKTGKSISKFNGVAIHVNYNANYQKSSLCYIPFKDVRFTTEDNKKHPNMIAIYDDWERIRKPKMNEDDVDFIHFYNPDPNVIQEQVDEAGGWQHYKGQIFYWSVDGLEYPLAPSDSVLEDIQTDSQTKIFKFRNITSNFMASHIIEMNEFEDEETKEDFLSNLNGFQGADDASKFLLLEKEADEPSFNLTKVDIQDIDKLYQYTEQSVRDNIIRNYLIPPVLVLAVSGKLGASSEIQDATAYYNGVTEDERNSVSEIFEELFRESIWNVEDEFEIWEVEAKIVPAFDTPEGKAKIVSILESNLLTDKEKRKLLSIVYGLSIEETRELIPEAIIPEGTGEVIVDEEAKAKATLRGSVGGVTSILAIQTSVANGTTSFESGKAILEIIFGLSEPDSIRVLGTPKDIIVA